MDDVVNMDSTVDLIFVSGANALLQLCHDPAA